MERPTSSRRETLARLALGGGVIFVGGWAYIAYRLVRSGRRRPQGEVRTGLRPEAVTAEGHTYPLALLYRNDGGELVALDRRCTHQSCRVRLSARSRYIQCPCHGSTFDREGRPLRGPAKRPLRRLRTSVDARGELVLHLGA